MLRNKIFSAFLIIMLFSIIGCSDQKHGIQSSDVELSAAARPFYDENEYMIYMNKSDTTGIENTIRIDIMWNIVNRNLIKSNNLYYPPYIIVIPSDNDLKYYGTNKNIPILFEGRGSISSEIIDNVLKGNEEYDWENIDSIGYFHARSKSFEQGFLTFAFSKEDLDPQETMLFKIIFIYYDPESKTGWFKQIDREANLNGMQLP